MRISDWSSDVCSSDLLVSRPRIVKTRSRAFGRRRAHRVARDMQQPVDKQSRCLRRVGTGMRRQNLFTNVFEAPTQQQQIRNRGALGAARSEEHTSALQSLMRMQ